MANVIGKLSKANAVGALLATAPDSHQVLVVDPDTNGIDRVTAASLRGHDARAQRYSVPTPVSTWGEDHDLDSYPTYICVRSDGVEVIPTARFPTLNRIELTFETAFSGVIQLHG